MPMATKEEQREYARVWIAARRKAWFDANGPCRHCGTWDRLELDHIDRATKVHHRVWSWSEARRTVELAKCQVLCRSCHLKKSHAVGDIKLREHGHQRMYEGGCRCALCRAWRSRKAARAWANLKARRASGS